MTRPLPSKSERHLKHGTIDGYYNHGCRCDPCKTVGRAYMRDRRRRAANYKPKGSARA